MSREELQERLKQLDEEIEELQGLINAEEKIKRLQEERKRIERQLKKEKKKREAELKKQVEEYQKKIIELERSGRELLSEMEKLITTINDYLDLKQMVSAESQKLREKVPELQEPNVLKWRVIVTGLGPPGEVEVDADGALQDIAGILRGFLEVNQKC